MLCVIFCLILFWSLWNEIQSSCWMWETPISHIVGMDGPSLSHCLFSAIATQAPPGQQLSMAGILRQVHSHKTHILFHSQLWLDDSIMTWLNHSQNSAQLAPPPSGSSFLLSLLPQMPTYAIICKLPLPTPATSPNTLMSLPILWFHLGRAELVQQSTPGFQISVT
jgi:hypothetical protein